jgi:hypothetical protein
MMEHVQQRCTCALIWVLLVIYGDRVCLGSLIFALILVLLLFLFLEWVLLYVWHLLWGVCVRICLLWFALVFGFWTSFDSVCTTNTVGIRVKTRYVWAWVISAGWLGWIGNWLWTTESVSPGARRTLFWFAQALIWTRIKNIGCSGSLTIQLTQIQ